MNESACPEEFRIFNLVYDETFCGWLVSHIKTQDMSTLKNIFDAKKNKELYNN